jgi:hypothetical protein
MTGRSLDKRLQLLGIPRLRLYLGYRSQLGSVSYQRHVPADQTSFHRIVEGASDDEMHLQHGLRRQS